MGVFDNLSDTCLTQPCHVPDVSTVDMMRYRETPRWVLIVEKEVSQGITVLHGDLNGFSIRRLSSILWLQAGSLLALG